MTHAPTPLIVIVEDEPELAKLMANYLEEAGMRTHVFHRSQQVLGYFSKNFANLLLIDINLPDISGFNLLKQLREKNISVPVIFVTGNSLDDNKVKGLNMGGDDYITKPFSYPELVARVRAVLRRAETSGDLLLAGNVSLEDAPFDFCGARVDPHHLQLTFSEGAPQKVGRKEIGIMSYLAANEGEVITRKALIHAVWGLHANVQSRSLDQYIVKIREYCKASKVGGKALRTVHGIGYVFDPEGKFPEAQS
jgi:two-component system alkaline phosphatase synthesis response regulator PhoP